MNLKILHNKNFISQMFDSSAPFDFYQTCDNDLQTASPFLSSAINFIISIATRGTSSELNFIETTSGICVIFQTVRNKTDLAISRIKGGKPSGIKNWN